MKKLAIATAVIFLVGCATSIESSYWDISIVESTLNSAKANAVIICNSKQECDKAFSLTKVYVQENADMKIEVSNDTMVATYEPFLFVDVGLTATKTPGTGDSAKIELVASCPSLRDADSIMFSRYYRTCARRVATIYRGFNLFVSSKL